MKNRLNKLLLREDPREGLHAFMDTVRGQETLPELYALKELGAHGHKDNFVHSIQVCAQALPYTSLRLRWAALYHDVGKAPTRTYVASKVQFHGHETVGAALTRRRLVALGYDSDFVRDVVSLVEFSGRASSIVSDGDWTGSAVRRLVRDMGAHLVEDAAALVAADVTSKYFQNHVAAMTRAKGLLTAWAQVQVEDKEEARRPPINGVRVMQLLGLGECRKVGQALKWLLENHENTPQEEAEKALLAWAGVEQAN